MSAGRGRRGSGLSGQAALLMLCFVAFAAWGNTFTVTNTNDSGAGSLRQAILDANTHIGLDTIAFNVTGTGCAGGPPAICTIVLSGGNLSAITDPVVIDGYSQPGTSPNTLTVGDNAKLLIEIDATGTNFVFAINGPSGGSTIKGLIFKNFLQSVYIGHSVNSSGNVVTGNFMGTDPTGLTSSAPLVNNSPITISGTGNTIGGTTPADRNLMTGAGLMIDIVGDNNTVQGNYMGVNGAGTDGLPVFRGITIAGSGNLIGGTASGAGNVIANFNETGIVNVGTSNNVIQGNFIGTNATGTARIYNGGNGIVIGVTGTNNVVGGTVAGAGNLISGNASGILINSNPGTGTLIQGNKIGTDVTGTLPIGNALAGVCIQQPGSSGMVGGTVAGAGNRIAFNGSHAIAIGSSTTHWGFLGNSIEANTGIGIALDAGCDSPGVLPLANDAGDGDTGSNNLQNYPILTSPLAISGGTATISGTLNSTASTTFRVEFFSNVTCDASGSGEGKTFIGFANVVTNGSGNVSFGPLGFTVPAGQTVVTATATDPLNNTSEFSPCIKLPPNLDIDGNTHYDALTDGLLTLRYLFGLTGNSLTIGAIGVGAARSTPTDVTIYLDNVKSALDVDANGQVDALTDGLMIIRYLFGLRGASLISGAIGPSATRVLAPDIEAYIASLMP